MNLNRKRKEDKSSEQNKKHIIIMVATHKKYRMPQDPMYLPLHVGREGKEDLGYTGDNTGDNISSKNSSWCELTGLYWGWKNLECDYLGLVQYRRHFMRRAAGGILRHKSNAVCTSGSIFRRKPDTACSVSERQASKPDYCCKDRKFNSILNQQEAEKLLQQADIVLPKKRNYHIDTLEEHFNGYDFSISTDIPNLRRIIHEQTPEYDAAFETVMNRKTGHMCNMFLMKKELADQFCKWEFQILEEFEKTIAPDRKRIVGYAAEHMLDIWIEKNGYDYVECGVVFLDRKNELLKRIDFVLRKLGLKKRLIRL